MCQFIYWHIYSRRDPHHQLDCTHTKHTMIMHTAIVTPISRKAKNRFANLMNSIETCIIEQHKDNRVFLTSLNGRNHFWAMLDKDPDWMVEL